MHNIEQRLDFLRRKYEKFHWDKWLESRVAKIIKNQRAEFTSNEIYYDVQSRRHGTNSPPFLQQTHFYHLMYKKIKLSAGYIHHNAECLDIGTRTGYAIDALKDMGFAKITGVDCAEINVIFAQMHKKNVIWADAHSLSKFVPKANFDYCLLLHVLEHCHAPLQVLIETYKVMKMGGVLHIEVPIEEKLETLRYGHAFIFKTPFVLRKMLTDLSKDFPFRIIHNLSIGSNFHMIVQKLPIHLTNKMVRITPYKRMIVELKALFCQNHAKFNKR